MQITCNNKKKIATYLLLNHKIKKVALILPRTKKK